MKGRSFPLFALSCMLLAILAACGGSSPSSTNTAANATPKEQTIKIPIGDFYVHSPQTKFTTGVLYHFVVTNEGKHHHDFLIMHPMLTETMIMDDVYKHALTFIYNIAPGETKTLNFTFDHTAPAGMLDFDCHYGGHFEAGMHQDIVVNAPSGTTVTPYANNAIPADADATGASNVSGKCDPPITTTIGANSAYKPDNVSLKMGDTLTISNSTQKTFTLTTTPDAGIRFTTVDPGEREYVPFPKAGTFTVASEENPEATLKVLVDSTAGVTCGFTSVATVNFDADYTNPQNQYFFVPTSVKIKEGQSITLSNLADFNLTFTSKPDADLGNIALDRNEHQLLQFSEEGTYTISCQQFPTMKVTVVVQDNDDDGDNNNKDDDD